MKIFYKVAPAEVEVMEVLWEQEKMILTRDLLELMAARGRNWKRQTLNTVISRLDSKGLVIRKRGYVIAALTEDELMRKLARRILDEYYDGKLKNFCVALFGKSVETEAKIDKLVSEVEKLEKES